MTKHPSNLVSTYRGAENAIRQHNFGTIPEIRRICHSNITLVGWVRVLEYDFYLLCTEQSGLVVLWPSFHCFPNELDDQVKYSA